MTNTMSSIGDALLATSANGSILFMNPLAEELTGWSLEGAMHKPSSQVLNFFCATSRTPVANPLCEAFVEEEITRNDEPCVLIAAGGKELQVDYTAAPICDDEGGVIGAVIVFRTSASQSRGSSRAVLTAVAPARQSL